MTTAVATEGLNIDAIVVWKLNWFSMSLEETIEWRDKLRAKGVQLLSVTERGPGSREQNSIRANAGPTPKTA